MGRDCLIAQSYHAVLAVNDERENALAAEEGGLRSLTAALRRGATCTPTRSG
jgi:hypothetical protein